MRGRGLAASREPTVGYAHPAYGAGPAYGGQRPEVASTHRKAIARTLGPSAPWQVAFWFDRPLRGAALQGWKGRDTHVVAALADRVEGHRVARGGSYDAAAEGPPA